MLLIVSENSTAVNMRFSTLACVSVMIICGLCPGELKNIHIFFGDGEICKLLRRKGTYAIVAELYFKIIHLQSIIMATLVVSWVRELLPDLRRFSKTKKIGVAVLRNI